MSKYDLAELESIYNTGQIVRTDRLLNILEHYGFQTRRSRGGSSHIHIWHADYPEIKSFDVVAGTKRRSSQRDVVEACQKVIEFNGLHEDHELVLVNDFEIAAEQSFVVPDAFEIVRGRKHPGIYLRHRNFPQIATQLIGYKQGDDISDKCEYLFDRAEKLSEALRIAETDKDYDIERYPNGTIILAHQHYPFAEVLYPFTPRLQNFTSISTVEDAIAAADLENEDYLQLLESMLKNIGLTETENRYPNKRYFLMKDSFDENDLHTLTLELTDNGFVSPKSNLSFLRSIVETPWINFIKKMKENHGFVVEDIDGTEFYIRHPISKVELTVPSVNALPSYDEQIKNYNKADKEERDELNAAIQEDFNKIGEAKNDVSEAIRQHQAVMTGIQSKVTPITRNLRFVEFIKRTRFGEIGTARFHVSGKPNDTIELPLMRLKGGSNKRPNTLMTLEAIKVLAERFPFEAQVYLASGLSPLGHFENVSSGPALALPAAQGASLLQNRNFVPAAGLITASPQAKAVLK